VKYAVVVFICALAITSTYYAFTFKTPMTNDSDNSAPTTKSNLSPEAYNVMFEGGTERAFSSPLYSEHRAGTFVTADTGLPVYRSEDKYDSGTGWPSFVKPIDGSVELREDNTLGMRRVEVISKDTHAHLGHVFDDGPPDRGGKRYCMNGVALRFIPD
jgi:methionine-R-sulfoxide reductase